MVHVRDQLPSPQEPIPWVLVQHCYGHDVDWIECGFPGCYVRCVYSDTSYSDNGFLKCQTSWQTIFCDKHRDHKVHGEVCYEDPSAEEEEE